MALFVYTDAMSRKIAPAYIITKLLLTAGSAHSAQVSVPMQRSNVPSKKGTYRCIYYERCGNTRVKIRSGEVRLTIVLEYKKPVFLCHFEFEDEQVSASMGALNYVINRAVIDIIVNEEVR